MPRQAIATHLARVRQVAYDKLDEALRAIVDAMAGPRDRVIGDVYRRECKAIEEAFRKAFVARMGDQRGRNRSLDAATIITEDTWLEMMNAIMAGGPGRRRIGIDAAAVVLAADLAARRHEGGPPPSSRRLASLYRRRHRES